LDNLTCLLGKNIELELSGKIQHIGILTDFGKDILVIYNGEKFLYIPLTHIHHFQLYQTVDNRLDIEVPEKNGLEMPADRISYRNTLYNAKGIFSEIYVAGNHSIHGYVRNVLSDYFVFYSPIHKMVFISLYHLKWLIPYPDNRIPYSLHTDRFLAYESAITFARTFKEQIKKMEGRMVMLDLGGTANKAGLLSKVDDTIIELIMPYEQKLYWNTQHIKTISMA
jgi:hypothetical protein